MATAELARRFWRCNCKRACRSVESGLASKSSRAGILGVYCEDDIDELHRRRDDIADAMECNTADLADALLWPRVDGENLLMTFTGGKGELTPFHKELLERALDERVRLVIFDTASDGFGGNEIDRTQVKRFVGTALGSIARAIKGAVVLCAHPSRAGMEFGQGRQRLD